MAIAGHCGVQILVDEQAMPTSETADVLEYLFNEELGAVFQVRKSDEINFHRCFATCGPPPNLLKTIGRVNHTSQQDLTIYRGAQLVYRQNRTLLQQLWSATSHQMQRLRDNPACADQEFNDILDMANPGLSYHLEFDPAQNIMPFSSRFPSFLSLNSKPRVAILREEGTNGQSEMAFAFMTVSLPWMPQFDFVLHYRNCRKS